MQFASALTFFSLGAMASASALPNVLGAYELAAPIAERDVPTLECDAEPIYTGTLKLVSSQGRESNAAFEGVRNAKGLQQLSAAAAKEEKFSFTSCKSTFLKYETEKTMAADVYFGRLQPASLVGKRCVSASELVSKSARLVSERCSDSDDSGQLLQFWTLTKQPDATGESFTYYLGFLGQPRDDTEDFTGSYVISKHTGNGTALVKLAHKEEEGARSPYTLRLV
ncbi:hypothetical protein ACQY0O_002233 [Thecaphora frezii]|nr:hypothetical protein [Thecaphora frezii]